MDKTCIYLRKSRTDEELEKTLGEGETLIKHRKALLKFAKDNGLNIVDIKEEIVSGDSIFFRPQMQILLKEVAAKKYTGVLVMDIDRLGRGGMKDQGTILETFKDSNTLIITPSKTYDLNDDIDEEMTEFKTFFARRELKVINKRMQSGRVRSIENGNYIATNPPLGYDITFINKFRTLKINESEAEIVKIIFNMYANGNGANSIATYLNELGYKTKAGNRFESTGILFIIRNPVYVGKVTWKKKEIKKSKDANKLTDTKTRDKSEWIIAPGKHKAIISEDLFNQVQDIINGRYNAPKHLNSHLVNPVAGIAVCGVCGRKLVMRSLRGVNRIMCVHKCGNKSSRFDLFENALIDALEEYLDNYEVEVKREVAATDSNTDKIQLKNLNKELTTLKNQKNKLFDLLERGLYDENIFLERSKNIDARIEKTSNAIDELNIKINNKNNKSDKEQIKRFKNLLDAYKSSNDVKNKNRMLKELLYKVEYFKDKKARGNDFTLKIFPKLLR